MKKDVTFRISVAGCFIIQSDFQKSCGRFIIKLYALGTIVFRKKPEKGFLVQRKHRQWQRIISIKPSLWHNAQIRVCNNSILFRKNSASACSAQ